MMFEESMDNEIITDHEYLRRELWKDAFIAYFNHKQDTVAAITHADRVTYTFDQRFNPTNKETKDG